MEVSLRYNYDRYERSPNDYLFVEYRPESIQENITNKKMLIFVQYYDKNHSNKQYFGTQFIDDNQIPILEWLVINDCNISSSTRILPCNNKFQNLIGLDLSFNSICDFGSIENIIKNSPKLQYLDLSHNPIEFQPNLHEIILQQNPSITTINRKRVTPTDFYNIYIKNQSNFNLKKEETKKFFLCQISAAIRTVEKDRIFPQNAEKTEVLNLDDYNLRSNFIDTYNIQAIDLSYCDLIYFDFTLFPSAIFIDISNNHIERVNFKNNPNKDLLYLDISGNIYKDYNALEKKFPECKINPFRLNKSHFLRDEIPCENDDIVYENYTFKNMVSDMKIALRSLPLSQEVIQVNIDVKEKLKNLVIFVNSDENNNEYTISSNSLKQTLRLVDSNLNISENIKINYNEVSNNSKFEISRNILYYPLYFVAYLNLKNIPINKDDFYTIVTKCNQLQKLIVKFQNIDTSKDTVTKAYFKDFYLNDWKKLTDLDIYFDNYSFVTKKHYNKFIKQICQIPHLKNFNIFGYTNDYSGNDEIDTTFKFLRGLNTFNGYRNLIPPTPAQYIALRSRLPVDNSNMNDNDNDNDNDKNNMRNKQYQNLNNLQFMYIYENDLQNTSSQAIKWSKALPIRQIKIANVQSDDVKDIVNQNSDFFDKYSRLKYVNGMEIKKELKAQNREESQNENQAFENWTSKVDKAFELFSQIQFFIIYSIKSSSSFVSKLLFFIYSALIVIERFLFSNNIKISTDFTSSVEWLVLISVAPILILKFLYWEPSYEQFIGFAKNKSKTLRILITIAVLVALGLIALSLIDSNLFEHDFVYFPYLCQFIIFMVFWGLILMYYLNHVYIRQSHTNDNNVTLQESTSFIGYLEFKYFKSKVCYSCLIILILPICNIFSSTFTFPFVDIYKILFASCIIFIIIILLFVKTNEQCLKIIEYLGFDTKNKEIEEERKYESYQDPNRTHYFVTNSSKNKGNSFAKIFDGAFQYKLTLKDNIYKNFAGELRTPTQICYSSYRYRGIQRFYGLIEIMQRICTEIVSKICIRWLFIVPLVFFLYVLIWWPHYDNILNISILMSSLGKVLMNLFNCLFYYFGYEDNETVQSLLTYMNICGMALNVFGILLLVPKTLYDLVKLEKEDEDILNRPSFDPLLLDVEI